MGKVDISIYKLDTTRNNFLGVLSDHYNMKKVGETRTQIIKKNIGGETITTELTLDFYFRLDSNEQTISWYEYWFEYFGSTENSKKTVESAFGVIVIEIENQVYGISLGRGHHYTNKIADMDFGLDVAEMIIRGNSIDLKSAKFFKQTKSRSLTQYNENTVVTNEIGESNEVVIGKMEIDPKYEDWIIKDYLDRVVFGTALKINVGEYKPDEIVNLVFEVHYISVNENENRKQSFPRISILKENQDTAYKISDLNRELLGKIKAKMMFLYRISLRIAEKY